MSRGFLIVLVAIAITLLGYFGVVRWAALPVDAAIRIVYGDRNPYEDLEPAQSLVLVIVLLFVNVGVWAFITWLAYEVVRPARKSDA